MTFVSASREAIAAGIVLQRRGFVDIRRPLEAVRASRAIRRYGSFGGLAGQAAARHGAAPAITDERGTLSFRELETRSNALARGLSRQGVKTGSVVGVLNRNHRDLVLALMATGKLGARVVLINTGFAAPQIADVCARENISTLLADVEFEDRINALPSSINSMVNYLDRLTESSSTAAMPAPDVVGGMVLLTSGTTGAPKGAPREKVSPLQTAQLVDRIPWPRASVYCVAAPLFHGTGLTACTIGLTLGNHVILARRFDPEATLASIEKYRATALVVVPTMLARILDLDPDVRKRFDTSSLKVIFASGSALSPELCRRSADAFGDVLYNQYGTTEVGVAAVATPDELRQAPGTIGRPPIGCTLAAYDEQRRRITTPGRTGTLFVSSSLGFSGYTDGANKESVDGLLSSGDTGHFNAEGLWFIDGRDDDMIVSGGENVFPLEVENLLAEHPMVVEAAVIGVEDEQFGKRLRAFVICRPGVELDAETVQSYVRSQLARHKVPRDVVFVESLPRNETGKVVKAHLPTGVVG